MKLQRLRGRKICDRVIRTGRLWKGKVLMVRWLPGAPRHPSATAAPAVYAGALASAKLDKSAVKRNRMRRRCREALRTVLQGFQTLPSVQLLIVPRSSSLQCNFSDIRADIQSFLSSLRAWQPPRNDRTSSSSR
ncbi:MAG: ribonuclease P protein component [Candidatus Peregrinibacteria bacterium]|nr:ribonuclease P protein component [Candidatus Peregrinibacteria bacterium]